MCCDDTADAESHLDNYDVTHCEPLHDLKSMIGRKKCPTNNSKEVVAQVALCN